jgi:hypothetical protein
VIDVGSSAKDDRVAEIVRQVAVAVALGTDPDELRSAIETTIEWAAVQRAAMVSAGKAMGELPDPEPCEAAGHEWAPLGGGMEICMRCERERETTEGSCGDVRGDE